MRIQHQGILRPATGKIRVFLHIVTYTNGQQKTKQVRVQVWVSMVELVNKSTLRAKVT